MSQPGVLSNYYLSCSAKGWAGGGVRTTDPALPGSKMIIIEDNGIRYADTYWTCPGSDRSFGLTIIWLYDPDGRIWYPVWHMQYGGHYPKRVISFLRRVLRQTYEAKEFVGGRGPREFHDGNLQYLNEPEENDFRDFKGEERILENGAEVGFHWYRGVLLLPIGAAI